MSALSLIWANSGCREPAGVVLLKWRSLRAATRTRSLAAGISLPVRSRAQHPEGSKMHSASAQRLELCVELGQGLLEHGAMVGDRRSAELISHTRPRHFQRAPPLHHFSIRRGEHRLDLPRAGRVVLLRLDRL